EPPSAPHPRLRPRQEKAARHLRHHLLHGGERVARVADRPPEHQVVGAEAHRLLGRHDALLIVRLRGCVAPRRAHPGRDDQEAAPALAPDARDLERRGDHAVHARLAREAGQAHHLVLDLGARVEEELLAHLEDADVLGEQRDQALGLGEGLDVEGDDQPVADAVGPGWEEGPAAGHQAPALARGPTSAAARAAASATGTSVACLSLRRFNSTAPRASARGPTVSRTGRPIRSASLNLTPGRSSRSSSNASTPTAPSSTTSRSAVSRSAASLTLTGTTWTPYGARGAGQMMPASS